MPVPAERARYPTHMTQNILLLAAAVILAVLYGVSAAVAIQFFLEQRRLTRLERIRARICGE